LNDNSRIIKRGWYDTNLCVGKSNRFSVTYQERAMMTERWYKLLNSERRKSKDEKTKEGKITPKDTEFRTEIERDYDRILFSTPIRRLADKTQVFPLDPNDSVRTRLTHSHEVANLGRSIGTNLVYSKRIEGDGNGLLFYRNLPTLLAAAGLVHDLGNPPFGHQGEIAIQSWFRENKNSVLGQLESEQQKLDFEKFEGNAQAFRLVTRLQILNDEYGLDLTYATLAAMMKYPIQSDKINKDAVATKKYGFFASEEHIAKEVLEKTGLSFGKRHIAAYIMEACDDIAYAVLDTEDAVKKGMASFSDIMAFLKHHKECGNDRIVKKVLDESEEKHEKYRSLEFQLSPAELNDISTQRFRVFAIGELVNSVIFTFSENKEKLLGGEEKKSLISLSQGEKLCNALKEFSVKHAYKHSSVLKIELEGYNVIRGLMDIFWASIIDREDEKDVTSERKHPFGRFVYRRISENYRRVFEKPIKEVAELPVRYRECQLLTDMISGMTDSYAVNLYNELKSMIGDYDPVAVRNVIHRSEGLA
jgi:dGTPase